MKIDKHSYELGCDRFAQKFLSVFSSQQNCIDFEQVNSFQKTLELIKRLTMEDYAFIERLEKKEEDNDKQ